MITRVKVGDIDVQCGLLIGPREVQAKTPFLAGNDWLQNMTISFFNRTNKTIVYGAILLNFPELSDPTTQPVVQYAIRLGRIPESVAFDGRTGKPLRQNDRTLLTFAPGQSLEIHLSDHITGIRGTIEHASGSFAVSNVVIHYGNFIFEDGMGWGGGCYQHQSPERPGVWRCVPERDYFPGDMRSNWPPHVDRVQ